jgi:hypothetical protein
MNWIKLTERLPKLNERVLISDDGYVTICRYKRDWRDKNKIVFEDEQDEQPSNYVPEFWQPLPKTPK